jgi:hypothetical protein
MEASKWDIFLCDVRYNEANGRISSATLQLNFKGNTTSLLRSQYSVTFNIDKKKWNERIVCACNYFILRGYPCFHSAYILLHLDKISCSNKKKKNIALAKIVKSRVWKYNNAKWYSDIYSVDHMLAQYSPPVVCSVDIHLPFIKQELILPPDARRRRGRKKKNRYTRKFITKRTKSNSTTATTNDGLNAEDLLDNDLGDDSYYSFSDDDSSEASDNDIARLEEARLQYIQRYKPNIDGKRINKCSHCGKAGHNCNTCDKRDVLYTLNKSPILSKLLRYPINTEPIITNTDILSDICNDFHSSQQQPSIDEDGDEDSEDYDAHDGIDFEETLTSETHNRVTRTLSKPQSTVVVTRKSKRKPLRQKSNTSKKNKIIQEEEN